MNIKELKAKVREGEEFDYLFFWGASPRRKGLIEEECFSQWYKAGFELYDDYYPTAEHFMMAEKAELFGDNEIREKILNTSSPSSAKKLGRKVRKFDEGKWRKHRFDIVVTGNLAKFSQNEVLREVLLNTGEAVLVEASPRDTIWGIGISKDQENAKDPRKWRGLNLLGFALMEVRKQLSEISD